MLQMIALILLLFGPIIISTRTIRIPTDYNYQDYILNFQTIEIQLILICVAITAIAYDLAKKS